MKCENLSTKTRYGVQKVSKELLKHWNYLAILDSWAWVNTFTTSSVRIRMVEPKELLLYLRAYLSRTYLRIFLILWRLRRKAMTRSNLQFRKRWCKSKNAPKEKKLKNKKRMLFEKWLKKYYRNLYHQKQCVELNLNLTRRKLLLSKNLNLTGVGAQKMI